MTKNFKIKLLIYAVIFLTVLNVAAIGTIIWHVTKTNKIEQTLIEAQQTHKQSLNKHFPQRRNRKKHLQRIFKTLDLSPEQQQQFMDEHQKFISQVKPLFHQLRKLHQNIALQLKQNNPNLDSIKYYSNQIGQIHAKLTYLEAKEFIALEKICTPQQRQKLFQLYSSRFRKNNRQTRKHLNKNLVR